MFNKNYEEIGYVLFDTEMGEFFNEKAIYNEKEEFYYGYPELVCQYDTIEKAIHAIERLKCNYSFIILEFKQIHKLKEVSITNNNKTNVKEESVNE